MMKEWIFPALTLLTVLLVSGGLLLLVVLKLAEGLLP